ncbi:MAG: hypothetical protein O2782_18190 [bacterium]|nr:hypothetical protein [bacterium]
MKITDVEVHVIQPPLQDFNAAAIRRYHGKVFQQRTVFVVHTDDGLEGIGEAIGSGVDAAAIAARYIGTSPFDWINAETDLALNCAMYDLMGKHLGLPAWKLMGPQVRGWIPVAAWSVSRPPQDMAEEVVQAARLGYRWLKYHVDEVQNVIEQTEAMQRVAPPGFHIHYDFNANSDHYHIRPILAELQRFPIAGRFEDVVPATDRDGYRLLKEQCALPIILHHGPGALMVEGMVDGYMGGHAPIGSALKLGAIAEATHTPIMYQQTGGTINQAFLAHEVSVVTNAIIDHVNLCHLWKEDVTTHSMPVISGSVEVPEAPGIGVCLDRDRLERCKAEPPSLPPALVRMCYGDGLTIYLRHDPDRPAGHHDDMRFLQRLHGFQVPGPPPSYASNIVTDFWEGDGDPVLFARLWQETETGPVWRSAD